MRSHDAHYYLALALTVMASVTLIVNLVFIFFFIQAKCDSIVCAFAKIFLTLLAVVPLVVYCAYSVAIFAWFMRYVYTVQKIKQDEIRAQV